MKALARAGLRAHPVLAAVAYNRNEQPPASHQAAGLRSVPFLAARVMRYAVAGLNPEKPVQDGSVVNKDLILKQTEDFVTQTLTGESTGHDWWHIHRVSRLAVEMAKAEGADIFIVQLAALLHDIDDYKLVRYSDTDDPRRAREWLEHLNVGKGLIDSVCQIITEMSFKGARVSSNMTTREGMVVQDADRLDAIGAIGIARAFAYGGARGRLIHDPDVQPVQHASFEDYKKNTGPTINHFYEKLLLLKDRMNTETGRQLAAARHQFMEQFLDQFFKEWRGEL